MTEGWMAEVVGERGCLDHIRINLVLMPLLGELLSESTSDLCDFEAVGQAIVEDMALMRANDLRDQRKAPGRECVDDPVAIAFKRGAVIRPIVALPVLPIFSLGSGHVPRTTRLRVCAHSGPE
jgi:hypothetical protein